MIHRSGFLLPTRHQGVSFCSCPKQARPPAEGVSGQRTHANIWVSEAECNVSVRSTSLLLFLWVHNNPPASHTNTRPQTHMRMKHKCICAQKPHTHKQRLHISSNPVMTAHPTFHPPFPVCVSLSEVLLCPADFETSIYSPWFNCVVGKFC